MMLYYYMYLQAPGCILQYILPASILFLVTAHHYLVSCLMSRNSTVTCFELLKHWFTRLLWLTLGGIRRGTAK